MNFLQGPAKHFQTLSQMFLYMVLAAWLEKEPESGLISTLKSLMNAGVVPSHNKGGAPSDQRSVHHSYLPWKSSKGKGDFTKSGCGHPIQPEPGLRREGEREGGQRRKVLSDCEPVPDGAGRRCSSASLHTCGATRGLPGYVHCFTSVS